ncbi:MAG: glycosyltransferase family 4 protein [Deltaproteobacteria bacterium]|jgi:glycosyltransferase involved in cell wall biosynthesis|nr:glycosyltransferase family 4 protein [Deltaproteobacteria bacterium]
MNIIIMSTARLATGGARQALYQAQALRAAGHRVRFVSYPESELRKIDPSLDWVDLPPGKLRALPAVNRTLRALLPAKGSGECAVVHAFHNLAVKFLGYLGTLWRLQGLPVVCAAHRGVTNRPGNPLPYLLPGIRAYISNSRLAAAQLPLLWRKKRRHLINNALPPERLQTSRSAAETRAALHIPAGHMVFGDVAHDKPEKGVERLLRAYAKARDALPPSSLVLVGVTPAKWQPLCDELGLAPQVRLLPRTEQVADYVQIFDLYVFPSYFIEAQPNVIMEAMRLGRPVIGSDVGDVRDMIGREFTFKAGDVDEMAARMLKMAGNPGLLQRAAAANLEAGRAYAPENRLRAILDIYHAILKEDGLA